MRNIEQRLVLIYLEYYIITHTYIRYPKKMYLLRIQQSLIIPNIQAQRLSQKEFEKKKKTSKMLCCLPPTQLWKILIASCPVMRG